MKRLVLICAEVYLLRVAGRAMFPQVRGLWRVYLGLVPTLTYTATAYGEVVTYSFLHASVGHLLVNMFMLWMFGSQEEMDWGSRRFLEFYLFCVVGAALVTIFVAYTGLRGLTPRTLTIGMGRGIYGLLIAFGILYGEQTVFLFHSEFLSKQSIWLRFSFSPTVIIATFQPSQGGVANLRTWGLFFGFLSAGAKTRPHLRLFGAVFSASATATLPLEAPPAPRPQVRGLHANAAAT